MSTIHHLSRESISGEKSAAFLLIPFISSFDATLLDVWLTI
jgi:hypothetical protein